MGGRNYSIWSHGRAIIRSTSSRAVRCDAVAYLRVIEYETIPERLRVVRNTVSFFLFAEKYSVSQTFWIKMLEWAGGVLCATRLHVRLTNLRSVSHLSECLFEESGFGLRMCWIHWWVSGGVCLPFFFPKCIVIYFF